MMGIIQHILLSSTRDCNQKVIEIRGHLTALLDKLLTGAAMVATSC